MMSSTLGCGFAGASPLRTTNKTATAGTSLTMTHRNPSREASHIESKPPGGWSPTSALPKDSIASSLPVLRCDMRLPGRWKTTLAAVMLAGLSPTQAGEILSLRITKQGQVELTFESDRGTTYEVQGSEDLQSFSLLTRLQGAEGKTRVLVDNPTGGVPDRRFFKVRPRELPPAPTWFRSYGGSREESHGH